MSASETVGPASRWNPLSPVRRRVQRWFLNRLPPTDTLTLTQRNVYILPPGEAQAGQGEGARAHNSGEFDGVRAYRRGDPQKTVVWKKAAQSFAAGRDDLVSRDTLSAQRQQLWLDHAQCGTHDLEARLSRLTAWVLIAERLELDYGLRLPGREIPPGQGTSHKTRCLEALALC